MVREKLTDKNLLKCHMYGKCFRFISGNTLYVSEAQGFSIYAWLTNTKQLLLNATWFRVEVSSQVFLYGVSIYSLQVS